MKWFHIMELGMGWTVVRERTELGYGEASEASIACATRTKSIFIKITWAVCTNASPSLLL